MGVLAGTEPRTGRVYTCRIAEIKRQVDVEDQAAIDRHIGSRPARAVADWLSDHGHPTTAATVTKHKYRHCACYRAAFDG